LLQAPSLGHSDAPQYAISDLGPLPRVADEVALGLNDSGTVSLWVNSGKIIHAAVWSSGKLTDLGSLTGYPNSIAHAISNRGRIAGWMNTSANAVDSLSTVRAFVYDGKQMTVLGTLGGRDSKAFAIDDHGRIAGVSNLPNGDNHAFVSNRDRLEDLGTLPGGVYSAAYAINRSGEIVGVADTPRQFKHAVLWRGAKIVDLGILPGGSTSSARAINNKGQIVGYADSKDGYHAFLFTDGRMQDLGTLGSDPSAASGVNDRGQVVGASNVTDDVRHAFLWQSGEMIDLNTLVAASDGWTIIRASAINNIGDIACIGQKNGEEHALLLTPLEPTPKSPP
jgi:probable HAF family extracellular repeat protein